MAIAAEGFLGLGLAAPICATLAELGYEEPTPVQRAAIPPLLAGRDVLAQAATGTGKTAAFALPLLHRLVPDAPPAERLAALVLCPTRELAMQVSEAVHRYGRLLGVRVLPIYGGAALGEQAKALRRGVDVVVATPGRALDHLRRGTLRLDRLRIVVLDECDEMLDMGFAEDIEAILRQAPPGRQTALFSATLPPRIAAIARTHLSDPVSLDLPRPAPGAGALAHVRQVAYIVAREHKPAALGRVLDVEHPASAILFCRMRTEVDELTETLQGRGWRAEALHGGLSQEQRDRVMQRFRARTSRLLVATDVAARGLDVQHLSHVINYDVPASPETYVHRIGRTGRAGRGGVAITLAEPRERRQLRALEAHTRQPIAVAAVPSVADLRERRAESAVAALRTRLEAGDLDRWRGAVAALAGAPDPLDIAAAALALAREGEAAAEAEEVEIPGVPEPRPERDRRPPRDAATGVPMATIYVGLGRKGKLAAKDLVGALVKGAGLEADSIGAIRITEHFSLVDVPALAADQVIGALAAGTIRGRRVPVRHDKAGRKR
ncbi:MAG: DEAD/DEAH box helicase [Gemmatimonadales bacterium]|nr:DEAD/DEAH box helicase [Gemmatimonadales bacterium]